MTKGLKLWVDDIRSSPSEDWTVARTVTEAIRAISRFDFEEISLDHDISHQVVVGKLSRPYPCDECFCAVAYFICEKYWIQRDMPENKELGIMRPLLGPKIILHSSNPVGVKEMEAILKDGGLKSEIKMMGISNRLEMEV